MLIFITVQLVIMFPYIISGIILPIILIEDDVVIRNCGRIHTEGSSSFGNGTIVAVLSETGARAVKIWDRLSAHQAYIIATLQAPSAAIKMIEKMTG